MTIRLLLSVPQTHSVALHSSPKPLTRRNDSWNGSFPLIDTTWTLRHATTGDHGSNSSDCCRGSLSVNDLCNGLRKRLFRGWSRSIPLSVSKTAEVTARSQDPLTITAPAVMNAFIYSFIHTWRKSDTHHPSHRPLDYQRDMDVDPSLPHSLQQFHILGVWITAPGLNAIPDRQMEGTHGDGSPPSIISLLHSHTPHVD